MIDEAPIKATVEELRKLIHISNYIGEPIESEDKILIPVSKAGKQRCRWNQNHKLIKRKQH